MLGSAGSTTLNLNKSQFQQIKFIVPPFEVMTKFHEIINPMFDMLLTLQRQIINLNAIRDTLLPKLMSGELRVPVDEEPA